MELRTALAGTTIEAVPNCALCGEEGAEDPRWAELLSLVPPYGAMRCGRCGLRWLSPRPGEDGLNVIYSAEHYFHGGEGTGYATFVDERRQHFRARAQEMMAHAGARILDYGAATGEFVAIARALGADAVGVEFSAVARAEALSKGVALLSPDEAVQLPPGFDAIHMNHVLEHMPDPLAHLRWCRSQLRPGGLIVVEVPSQFDNDLDATKRMLGKGGKQAGFDAFSLHHTYFFTPRNIAEMFKRAGFQVRRVRTFVPTQRPGTTWKREILRRLLWLSDRLHYGGDVIEIYAER